ncbi:putative hydro-lyase [Halomonadaceae bacterium LMG 33818]|uniref:putative hydro-lyase n=1 Tax=Cernens ardua TaxID=3402176 RepID=UPI003EDB9E79
MSYPDSTHRLAASTVPRDARLRYRQGFKAPSAGVAHGFAQANMIALPKSWAYDFLLYAQRNPKSCPLLDVTDAGVVTTPLGKGADLRTDFPAYRIWRNGQCVDEVTDATPFWNEQEDLVSFLIGCSFTFESGLIEDGIEVRHICDGSNVPMYLTNRACRSAERLHGQLVVSMRPIPADRVADAVRVTARYPNVHGAPVHIGYPEGLGISDLTQPDFGEAVRIKEGEIPVFWACGVTPQAAIMASGVPFAITHAPGHMFITDVPNHEYHL